MPDITELTQDEINAALAQLKLISEFPTPSTQYARVVRKYIATLVEAQKKAHSVMSGVVTAACIRGVRPFDGIECDPPTLEENAEACGDAMSARIRELESNPPKPKELAEALFLIATLREQSDGWERKAINSFAERTQMFQRIAELEKRNQELESGLLIPAEVESQDRASDMNAEAICVDGNKPGMIVAVHIDAGDFVNVNGLILKVIETDFDDHDVTLYLAGGEEFKCAAGYLIEVVPVPEDEE